MAKKKKTKTSADLIVEECDAIKEMLLGKNQRYKDSAFNPVRIFSKADAVEQLKIRADDKISRIINNSVGDNEDSIKDLIGYLVLLRIAERKNK